MNVREQYETLRDQVAVAERRAREDILAARFGTPPPAAIPHSSWERFEPLLDAEAEAIIERAIAAQR